MATTWGVRVFLTMRLRGCSGDDDDDNNGDDNGGSVPRCPFRCPSMSLVVPACERSAPSVHQSTRPFYRRCAPSLNWPGHAFGAVTLKKLECSKQAYALDTLAWDNIIGFRSLLAFGIRVMISMKFFDL
ncbi:hypothetical protein CMV_001935 [Castanea mollissima]|uniref:Uncharacterized protein n=1 Tax=Castanea mollissima TaxID=60419 RepID=A0A8J4W652_9ROSI|nr:hypothetical protein CMV_001935 [Castanea mollissima]